MKKKILKSLVITTLLTLPCATVQASNVKLNTSNITITQGLTKKLHVLGTKAKIKWTSGNKKIATVTSNGTVKGVQSGNTYVEARVGTTNLRCRVTVKAKELPVTDKKISYELKDTGDGVIGFFTNNNSKPVTITSKLVFLKSNKMVDTSSGYTWYLEPKKTTIVHFYPFDKEYDDYKLSFNVSQPYIKGTNKLKIVGHKADDNVTAEVTNISGKQLSIVSLGIVFYDENDNAIDYGFNFAECKDIGSTDYVTFNFPYDKEFNTIIPERYEIYILDATLE